MSNEIRRGGTENAEVLGTKTGGAPADPAAGNQKGIFDHLAEYLLQQPLPEAPPAPVQPLEAPREASLDRPLSPQPVPFQADEAEMRGQELVFAETAEQLVVEKEAVVREEVVLSKLVKEHVEEIEDRVRRTEVEVERLSTEEAQAIVQPAAAAEPRPAPSPPAAEPKRASQQQAERASSESKGWWAWFALILVAAVLLAFALGQFLGSGS